MEWDLAQYELEIQDLNKKTEHLENASKEEIVELKSEISSLKNQLALAKKDIQKKNKHISNLKSQLKKLAELV